jgi:hypothetical protein
VFVSVKHTDTTDALAPAAQNWTAGELMSRWGYRSRSAFWQFVHASGVPHLRLNARRVVFERRAVESWEAKRRIGGVH